MRTYPSRPCAATAVGGFELSCRLIGIALVPPLLLQLRLCLDRWLGRLQAADGCVWSLEISVWLGLVAL